MAVLGRTNERRHEPASRVLQLTWRQSALHLWAIDPADGTVAATPELSRIADRTLGGHVSMLGALGRMRVELPAPLGNTATSTLRVGAGTVAGFPDVPGSATLG